MFLLSIRVGQIGRPFKIYIRPSGGKRLDSRSQCRRKATKKRSMPWANCWIGISRSSLPTTIEHFTRSVQLRNSKARSSDLNLLGFPGTSIPGPMDLGQKEHVERPPRTNPRIPILSSKVGFLASPVGPCQCLYGEAEFPELTPPIDPMDRPQMPWERLYDHLTDNFVELIGMLVTLSHQAYQHPKPAQQILDDPTGENIIEAVPDGCCEGSQFLGHLMLWRCSHTSHCRSLLVLRGKA